ncbi:MAG: type II secretion system F family protein [Lachnospiraceae bacterium]|nr:type II secretion system F family protein [Lachnospiraceae bacterium]
MINYICVGIYLIFALIWIVLLLSGSRAYGEMIEPLDTKKYLLKSLYGVGFAVLGLIHYSFDTPVDRKRMADAKIVYGAEYGEYYYRVNVAEKITYVSICILFTPLLVPITGQPLAALFGIFAAAGMYYYSDTKITDITKEREASITKDFPDMVSKMALLINAGMITREAWKNIAETGDGVLYEEMRIAVQDMEKRGVSEADAYIDFGNRCGLTFIKKFIAMLVQNIAKGNQELVNFLRSESAVCWEEKKHLVKRQGEEASNKLMLPLGMIMVGLFIMILVPILSNMGI